MTGQARAGATSWTQAVSRTRVQGRVSEGAQQLRPRVRVRQHPEAVEGAQGVGGERGGRGRRTSSDAQVGVIRQRQVRRERVGQVPRGRRMAHHIGVEGRVGRVRPRHGQTLAFVLHPPVLKPDLEQRHAESHINHAHAPMRGAAPMAGADILLLKFRFTLALL